MNVTRLRHLTIRLIGAVMLSVAVLLCPKTLIAAEGPGLHDGDGVRLNTAQLRLLFSGSNKIKAISECFDFSGFAGTLTSDFVFKDDGTFSVYSICETGYRGGEELGNDKGTLTVDGEDLCLKFEGNLLNASIPSSYECWTVRRQKNPFTLEKEQFSLYGGSDKIWDLEFSHPKFGSKEKLLAALEALSSNATAKSEMTRKAVTTAQAVTLPPAPYKALPVGARIKYDDRIYRVTKSDGYLTVFRSITGDEQSYLNTYALFGEYADNLYVLHGQGDEIALRIDNESKSKLEAFWPLKIGKKVRFNLSESALSTHSDEWTVALDVAKAETIVLKGEKYDTYVIDEEGKSGSGKSYSGSKWYHPATGLIIKAERTWTKAFPIAEGITPRFAEGETDSYSMVRVRLPKGTKAIAQASPALQVDSNASAKKAEAAELARQERQAEEKRKAEAAQKARAQEIARLEREAEEKRKADEEARRAGAQELARLEREAEEKRKEAEAQKARAQEIARLKREAEAVRKVGKAEGDKATTVEIARLKQEAEAVQKAHEREIANLKRETEATRKAEIARLKKESEEEKVRNAEIQRLKREAKTFQKALAERDALESEVIQKAREAETARLKQEDEEEKVRNIEIERLKREAKTFQKALAERDVLEAQEEKARKARETEIASLRRQLDEALKARKTAVTAKAKINTTDVFANIEFGNYHALVIGINNYKNLPQLTTAINDAKGVAKVLKDEYGFKVTTLLDPDRLDIIDAFDELRETLGPKDNLLIYYAGHGWLDEDADQGYWLPVNAKKNRRGRWMSNATITDNLKALNAKHVIVVADSCYSGTLVRGTNVGTNVGTRKRKGDYWKEMAEKWARVAITSGGLEPVADKGGSGHSPFAKAFIDVLRENVSVMDGMQLFGKMRRPVMVASEQTPQYADVRQAGHDGGDFLFVRKN